MLLSSMKFPRTKVTGAVFIAIFQGEETGRDVLRNLRRHGFRRSALLRSSASGKLHENGGRAAGEAGMAAIIGLLVGGFLLWRAWLRTGPISTLGIALILGGFTLGGALVGWLVARILLKRTDDLSKTEFKRSILPNETMVMIESAPDDASRVLEILRDVGDDPSVLFGFHSTEKFEFEPTSRLFRREAPSRQRLAEKAERLAKSISNGRGRTARGPSLLRRLRESERILKWTDAGLSVSAEVHQSFGLSSEWLLDNAYLIQEQINDIRRSLPRRYYEELPVVAGGLQAGLPRVYRIASEIVAESDGALDAEILRNFLVAFQTASPLKIGELWAIPTMLRLRLVECLRSLAIEVEQLQRGSEEADFWANRLITAARRSPERLLKMTEELVQRHPQPTAHFASELVAHLYDEEAPLPIVTSWLERSLRAPLLEVVQQEHRRQAVQQASLSNVIGSCRRLAQIQWGELFEAVSRADVELARGSCGCLSADRFRNAQSLPRRGRAIGEMVEPLGTRNHRPRAVPCRGRRE